MDNKESVFKKLAELNINYKVIYHEAAYTIDDMEALHLENMSDVAKNLFLRDYKGRKHYLVVLEKDKTADLKYIKTQIGSTPLSFASEERLMKYLKLVKGSVSPLGILNDTQGEVEVVFDKELAMKEKIGVHPNDNTATVFLDFKDLQKIIELNGNKIHFINI